MSKEITCIKARHVGTEEISPRYSSRTASPLYISAEQHRPCRLYISAEQHRLGSGYPWEWRPQTDDKYGQVNPRDKCTSEQVNPGQVNPGQVNPRTSEPPNHGQVNPRTSEPRTSEPSDK